MGTLFVIHARDVAKAIIIRRGPSRWSHLISWNTEKDEFEHGAWIKGRIYPEKCDLSPDGQLFVYFVHGGRIRENGISDSWTGLSQPPWLKALALWTQGMTYYGGGRFTDDRKLALCGVFHECHPDFPNFYVEIDKHTIVDYNYSSEIVMDSDWSGKDIRGNVIYTKNDQVFRILESGEETVIADFSDLKPDPQPAPEWTKNFKFANRKWKHPHRYK